MVRLETDGRIAAVGPTSRYVPHQGVRERARRVKALAQLARLARVLDDRPGPRITHIEPPEGY